MSTHRRTVLILIFTVVILAIPLAVGARSPASENAPPPATILTVNTGIDIDNSPSTKCKGETYCTLRRAIVEARALLPGDRPVLIEFDIPKEKIEGYNSSVGAWELELLKPTAISKSVFRTLEFGQITIDGTTQPGGRTDGPKIVLVGPALGTYEGIIVGTNASGSHDGNVIRGLAFQNFKTHLFLNSNDNLITENWFGLTSNGEKPYLRDGDPQQGSGSGGIFMSAGASNNEISKNIFLGFDGTAAKLHGDDNTFDRNLVGTNGQGKIPAKQTDPDLICTKVDWLGGGGLAMEGDDHIITHNIFAGLRQQISNYSNQPDAILVTGRGHTIGENFIGVDNAGKDLGVCGRGIFMSDGPRGVLLQDNVIANPGMSAISLNGPLYDENELRGNVIRQRVSWPTDINPQEESAIQLGKTLPDALLKFRPARVTEINGKVVKGTAGAFSPCPDCVVELFLDDKDAIVEALESMAVVTADSSGNWKVQMPRELQQNEALRTTSTSAKYNTIPGLSAGTTTGLSEAYYKKRPPYYLPVILGD